MTEILLLTLLVAASGAAIRRARAYRALVRAAAENARARELRIRIDRARDDERRWCDNGCGYRLPDEYLPDDTTCGACINLQAAAMEADRD